MYVADEPLQRLFLWRPVEGLMGGAALDVTKPSNLICGGWRCRAGSLRVSSVPPAPVTTYLGRYGVALMSYPGAGLSPESATEWVVLAPTTWPSGRSYQPPFTVRGSCKLVRGRT